MLCFAVAALIEIAALSPLLSSPDIGMIRGTTHPVQDESDADEAATKAAPERGLIMMNGRRKEGDLWHERLDFKSQQSNACISAV